jgi:hypothetical protein
MSEPNKVEETSALHRWIVIALAVVILGASMYGFGDKFVQFIKVARGERDGMFALTPIINYLMASFGFLCLLGWAAANGMFHDIELPKYTMLENDERLEAAAQYGHRLPHEDAAK